MNIPLSKRYKDPLVTLNIKSTSENTHENVEIMFIRFYATEQEDKCKVRKYHDILQYYYF